MFLSSSSILFPPFLHFFLPSAAAAAPVLSGPSSSLSTGRRRVENPRASLLSPSSLSSRSDRRRRPLFSLLFSSSLPSLAYCILKPSMRYARSSSLFPSPLFCLYHARLSLPLTVYRKEEERGGEEPPKAFWLALSAALLFSPLLSSWRVA